MSEDTQEKRFANFLLIPIEVLDNQKLSSTEKLLFGMIYLHEDRKSGKGCYATNNHLEKEMSVSTTTISTGITHLSDEGFITLDYDKDNKRTIFTNFGYFRKLKDPFQNPEIAISESCRTIYNKEYKIKNENNSFSKEKEEPSFNKERRDALKGDRRDRRREVEKETIKDEKIRKRRERLLRYKPSEDAGSIIEYWNNICIEGKKLPQHSEGSERYRTTAEAIDALRKGTFFSTKASAPDKFKSMSFGMNQIEKSIDRFAISALNSEYAPEGEAKERRRKTILIDFFYRQYSPTDNLEYKSPFLYYLDKEPSKRRERRVPLDTSPQVMQFLAQWFKKMTNMNGRELTSDHWRGIEKCVTRIKEVLPDYKKKIRNYEHHKRISGMDDETFIANYLTEAIKEDINNLDLSIGWLCSDKTFEVRLPKYLEKINAVGDTGDPLREEERRLRAERRRSQYGKDSKEISRDDHRRTDSDGGNRIH